MEQYIFYFVALLALASTVYMVLQETRYIASYLLLLHSSLLQECIFC